jgi:hypothetical protein
MTFPSNGITWAGINLIDADNKTLAWSQWITGSIDPYIPFSAFQGEADLTRIIIADIMFLFPGGILNEPPATITVARFEITSLPEPQTLALLAGAIAAAACRRAR